PATTGRAGRKNFDRRLWHRLFQPVVSQAAAGQRVEDRPRLHQRADTGFGRCRHRLGHHRPWQSTQFEDCGRRRGDPCPTGISQRTRMRFATSLSARSARTRRRLRPVARTHQLTHAFPNLRILDAHKVFTIISVAILANGTALAIAYRGWATSLRPAARLWQWGTLLIAAGCALFAWGDFLPRPVMLTLANGAMAFGLTGYCLALRNVHGLKLHTHLWGPAIGVTLGIFWFSAVAPD